MAADANRVVVELIGDTGSLDSAVSGSARSFERGMAQIETSARTAERQVVVSSGAMANAQRNLGRQVSDIGTQLAGGQSPFLILAQQGPQVADALTDVGGKIGAVAGFLSGPLGAALFAGTTLAASFAAKLLEGGAAADEKKRATKDLTDAIDELNKVTGAATLTEQQHIGILLAASRAEYAATVQTRDRTKALLEQAIANEKVANRPIVGGGVAGTQTFIQGQASNRVAELRAELDKASKAADQTGKRLNAAFQGAVSQAIIQRVEAQTDKAGAANKRYADTLIRLQQDNQAGRLSNEQFAAAVSRVGRERDAAVAAANRHSQATRSATGSTREAEKAERDHAKAIKELQTLYDGIVRALDPATAALDTYRERLADIDKLVRAGKFTPEQAAGLKAKAQDDYITQDVAANASATAERRKQVFGDDPAYNASAPTSVESTGEKQLSDRFEIEDKVYQRQQDNVKSLASLYRDAFEGGAGGIWGTFKNLGEQVIAELLAKWTLGQLTSLSEGSGGVAKLAKGALSLFGGTGRASGGSVSAGTLYRVNESGGGRVEGFMPASSGKVIPLGDMPAAMPGGSSAIYQSIDLRGAIVDKDLWGEVNAIAARHAQGAEIRATQSGARLGRQQAKRQQGRMLGQ